MPQNFFNPEKTKQYRRELRAQPVAAERILWGKLRNRQLGFRFNRQYGIGGYIVDFYCADKKLVIEIDGATHSSESEVRYDKAREEYLVKAGFTVKRYTNRDVFERLSLVLGDIDSFLSKE